MSLKCSACEIEQEASQQQGNYIDYGWSLNWVNLGHYGGFTDSYFDRPDDPAGEIIHLCHDCCIKLLNLFPLLVDKIDVKGGHPNMNEMPGLDGIDVPPCCPYCWTFVKDESKPKGRQQYTSYRATADLKWEAVNRDPDEESQN